MAHQQSLLDAHQWTQAGEEYIEALPMICLCLKMATEVWLQKLWQQLVVNYDTSDPAVIATAMKHGMADTNSSVLYRVQSVSINRHYEGLVQQRPAVLRKVEHDQCIMGYKLRSEARYPYMFKHGKAASWWFVPMVCAEHGVVVPLDQLEQMENSRINMTQQSLNKMGNYSKPKRSVRNTSKPTAKAEATITATPKDAVVPRILYRPSPMYLTVEGIFLDEGVPRIEKSGDIVDMLIIATIVIAHTSRLQYSFTALKRKYGKSVFKIKTSLGLSFQGELSTALRWVKKLNPCWVQFNRLHLRIHNPVRPSTYNELLQVALKEEKMDAKCANLSAESLWKLWSISCRHTTAGVHRRNIAAIRKALRAKGITATPDSEMVIKIPSTVQVKKKEVRRVLQAMLNASFLYSCIAQYIARTARVVQETVKPLGTTLDTTKHWVGLIQANEALPCVCQDYAQYGFPMRHGHIFVPSWQYKGPFQDTVREVMNSKVRGRHSFNSVLGAVKKSWARYLPSAMMPTDFYYDVETGTHDHHPGHLDWGYVRLCIEFLSSLVIMGIDKCQGRKLLLCPVLFERYYNKTFPVESDSVHFAPIRKTIEEYDLWIKKVYDLKRWSTIATMYEKGDAPEPYPLFKLKDILAPCEQVLASKGTCCRNRPISPNVNHWLRRVYRRVGSVLRFLCIHLPPSVFNIMSVTTVKPSLAQAEADAAQQFKGKDFKWFITTGDISNCYDELVHSRILTAIEFWLHMIPKVMNRRTTDRFSVNRYNRRMCVMGNDNTGGDYITITVTTIMDVCKFDCENSILKVRGKLYRRKLV